MMPSSWKSQLLHLSFGICLLLSFANGVHAQETQALQNKIADADSSDPSTDQDADKPETDSERYSEMTLDEIQAELTVKFRAYSKRYRAAPTAAEKREVFKDLPKVTPYWPRLIALINEDPGSDEGLKVVDWWYRRDGRREGAEILVGLLTKHYSEEESIRKYVSKIAFHLPDDQAEESLRKLLKVNSFDSVKASATYELHQLLKKRVEELEGETADSITAEVKSLRDSIFAEYVDQADTRGAKYSELLAAEDFAANLEIGKPVPDIEGVDIDGVEFKLSDYDGKVIVVSFWGDW